MKVRVTFDNSDKVPRIQVCDLLIGAAGSYGNCMQELRQGGRRGMSEEQKARLEMCKHVYARLRSIDAKARGSLGFNWFESTGRDGDRTNMLSHPVNLEVQASTHRIHVGLQRAHLGPAGEYLGPQIRGSVRRMARDWASY